jgi:D-tyrosyl-tRNA(Tyr) deacylase
MGRAMRILVQRVKSAWVSFQQGGETPRSGAGLLALVGFRGGDTEALLEPMARKLVQLRIFADAAGKMNRSLLEMGGDLVLVSQFTLYADVRKGRRPSFADALEPVQAERLYTRFAEICAGESRVVTSGRFGAMMDVHLVNDGPVTLLLDSAEIGISPASPAA